MVAFESLSAADETQKKSKLELIKTLWGIDDPVSPELFKSIKEEGYFGVEVIRLNWILDKKNKSRDVLVNALNEAGLGCVTQMHTSGGYIDEEKGEYIYCGAYDVAAHQEDFKKQLRECKDFLGLVDQGGFVNVHAGVDAWSNNEAVEFLEFCFEEIEQTAPDITVTFETHRQRIFGSPFQTRDLLALPALSESKYLKLNADLSHWYCACERVFNPKEDRDKWWPSVLGSIASRCEYIHARFGWAQGPQMADPSAPECEQDRNLQIEIWKKLVVGLLDPGHIGGGGPRKIFVSPEYGPAPYLAVQPRTQEPVSSLTDAVSYTKKIIEELFESME